MNYNDKDLMNNLPSEEKLDDDVMVTVQLDDGREIECEILTIFEAGGREYIALEPVEEMLKDDDEDEEIFLYRFHEDEDGNATLENIQSDEEYEIVSDRFDELLDEAMFDELND